jgi:hypothetical protein
VIQRLPLPTFAPDQTIASGVLTDCRNAIPAADDSYRPLRAIATISDALAAAFNGGASAIAVDGTGYLLAGTATNLYKFNAGAWTSLVGSLTITSRWRFVQFGNYVVAVNGSATREINLATGADSAIAAAPDATSIAVVGDHVVVGQPDGAINEVSWCAFRNHTAWTPGTDQAGNQPFQTGGAVQGIAGGEYGIVLQRERIVRMSRTGDATAPFQFDEVSANFGCSNGSTIAQAGRTVFFHSDRGFMALDNGQELRPIGSEKVDRSFEAEVGRDNFGAIYCAVDPVNKLVLWGVPGSPGKLWIYNFELDRWSTGVFAFTGFLAGFTTSTTLEALAVTYTDLDAMTISLDDARWSGGHPRLYFVDADRKIGTLTGDTLPAQFKMAFAELVAGQRATVSAVRPITDATEGVTVTLDARARLGDAQNTVSHGTILPSGVIPIRSSGRYHAPTLQFDAGAAWSYARGLEIECQAGGSR